MINLPCLEREKIQSKKVLVRADLDIDLKTKDYAQNTNLYRLEALIPTLRLLYEADCEIVLIGHCGRPGGKIDDRLSLKPVSEVLENLLKEKWGSEDVKNLKMQMMENLRYDAGEEANDGDYANHLAENGEFFINEAFAASHREHASIVTLPKLLPHAAGLRFEKEIENLSKLRETPQKPFIAIISGVKEDKLEYARKLENIADKILIAGRLPDLLKDDDPIYKNYKYTIAHLLPDKEEITIHSIEDFDKEIQQAGTIFVSGPIGKFEEEGHRLGTKRVFEAIASSQAYKVVGGGDTIAALGLLNIIDKFDWVSVGGGASLELITNGTLPGIKALID